MKTMTRWPTITGLGIFLFLVGFYFFPAFMDVAYWLFMNVVGGDFFKATVLMYIFSVSLMLIGVAIASKRLNLGPFNFLKNPAFMLLVVVALVASFWIIIKV